MEKERTIVIFRTWKHGKFKGDVDALFPEFNEGNGLMACYAHVGQHGGANYYYMIKKTRPATKEEYLPLLEELKSIGYENIVVYKRRKNK